MDDELEEMKKRWLVSIGFLLPLMYVSMGPMTGLRLPLLTGTENHPASYAFIQFLFTLPIVLINRKYYRNGFRALWKKNPNMDSLIAIGSGAAFVYGIYTIFRMLYTLENHQHDTFHQLAHELYFESAATILTLITLGKWFESRSRRKTTDAISKMLDLSPKTAIVFRNDSEIEILTEDIRIDDVIIIRPGNVIPVDGIIIEGSSTIDESSLTGESIPVFRQPGDRVYSPTINKSGAFRFKATAVGSDTTLSRIVTLVESAAASKAPISKLADKISAVFVPIVIATAFITAIAWLLAGYSFDFAISMSISVLVISCPCALGLATPVAIMVGTGKGAELGILIKSAESLEIAAKADTVVFDKTGTLTENKPRVTDIICNNRNQREVLQLAASLEKWSEHPLADAIINDATEQGIDFLPVEQFQAIHGQGIEGVIGDKKYVAGNFRLINDKNLPDTESWNNKAVSLAQEAKTPLFIANETEILGIIAVADPVKQTSIQAVAELKKMNMEVVMITGDHAKTASVIGSQLGINTIVSEVLPDQKDHEVQRLQQEGRTVIMVGDGVNDAPALTRANVGIAIGAGTDIAIESADIVLMHSNPTDIVNTLKLSRNVLANIKQNLFWAFFYNILGIPLAAGAFYYLLGWKLNPMFAAAAMSMSSVSVVLNALRLRRFKAIAIEKSKEIQNPLNTKPIMIQKTMIIKGMSCGHCSARVEKALNAVDGIEAKVDLETNTAQLNLSRNIDDDELTKIVDNIGYEVVEIK